MSLHYLSAGGSWRSMWNEEVLPYLRSLQLTAGDGLMIDRRPAGTWIRALPKAATGGGTGGAGSAYSSYFKLSGAPAEGGYAVTVADGATGGNSTAVVNGGTTYSIEPYTETVTGDRLFFLKYTPAQYSGGAETVSASLVIASLGPSGGMFPMLPSGGTDDAYYMQLGRCLWNNGSPRIVQDFTAGVAEFNWYVACNSYAEANYE